MKFDDAIKEKIESVLQTTPPFNHPFVKEIRDLETFYGFKINYVLRDFWAYPYSGCPLPPRKLVPKENGLQSFEKTADEHCCSCPELMDIKYMRIPQLETYVNCRSTEFKKKDLMKHQENLPLYEILNPELVSSLIEEKQLKKPILSTM